MARVWWSTGGLKARTLWENPHKYSHSQCHTFPAASGNRLLGVSRVLHLASREWRHCPKLTLRQKFKSNTLPLGDL